MESIQIVNDDINNQDNNLGNEGALMGTLKSTKNH